MSDGPGPRRKPRFFYGWVIVAVVAAGGFTQSAETFNVLSVFLKPMSEEFGWSRTTFAGAMALGSLFGGVVALFLGPLMDQTYRQAMSSVGDDSGAFLLSLVTNPLSLVLTIAVVLLLLSNTPLKQLLKRRNQA